MLTAPASAVGGHGDEERREEKQKRSHHGIEAALAFGVSRAYSGRIQAVFRLYSGRIQGVFRAYLGRIHGVVGLE